MYGSLAGGDDVEGRIHISNESSVLTASRPLSTVHRPAHRPAGCNSVKATILMVSNQLTGQGEGKDRAVVCLTSARRTLLEVKQNYCLIQIVFWSHDSASNLGCSPCCSHMTDCRRTSTGW